MNKFDTNVQYLKYFALKEIAKAAYEDNLNDCLYEIPKRAFPGPKPTVRCCVYKERAIFTERLKLARGGEKNDPYVIQVIDIACDECLASGYTVTSLCRGCIAHRCLSSCKKNAITFDENQKAVIDKNKCVNCGMCAKACQFSAITNNIRPCENACKLKAIKMGEDHSARIIREKCISCGACVYQCPFGAITDKSFIVNIINMLRNKASKVYAIIAPSILNQFTEVKFGQVISGIKLLGFDEVVETALGADMVALKEAEELEEKKFLTSSCCPAFKEYIIKSFPNLIDKISSNLSPMAELGKFIKSLDPTNKVVFIGPCTAKKMEMNDEKVIDYVDSVMTFEELQALLDSREINLSLLEETLLTQASDFGRGFRASGGLTNALRQAMLEQNIDMELKPIICNGIDECKMSLTKASKNLLDANFIEGMACVDGCIGGPCCITHNKNKAVESTNRTITDSLSEKI